MPNGGAEQRRRRNLVQSRKRNRRLMQKGENTERDLKRCDSE